jgi:MT-A70 protein
MKRHRQNSGSDELYALSHDRRRTSSRSEQGLAPEHAQPGMNDLHREHEPPALHFDVPDGQRAGRRPSREGQAPAAEVDEVSLVIAPRREHSRKPDEVHRRIERLARGPYLELIARQSRRRWDRWEDQPTPFDAGTVRTRN